MVEMVLVIEDEPNVATVLTQLMEWLGYAVTVVGSAADALAIVGTTRLRLILLDLVLPDSDGLILLAQLRTLTPAPIVVCSARSYQVDRVLALKLGADDFVAKPFDLDELDARITAVLRRSQSRQSDQPSSPNALQVGELVVAPSRGTATIARQPLQLTPTQYRLLTYLASHAGVVLSRRALAQALWGYADSGTDHMIDVHVARIRRKIRESGGEQIIVTVHGAGYVLSADGADVTPPGCLVAGD